MKALQIMNEGDISDILPSIEEQNTRFVEISHNKAKPFIESTAFQKIFYKRRSMKELLEERTVLCIDLGLTSSRKPSINLNRTFLALNFGLLFKDCPSQLDEYSWTILEDRGTVYGFLASQEKFAPHCKACNYSVYVSLRGSSGRITCSNTKCRIKLLSEFELATESKPKPEKREEVRQRESRTVSQPASKVKTEQKPDNDRKEQATTEQEREMIKRAAKRIVQ